jgi:predicted  nucleic acid-binding Zn-ribbon protein
VLNEFKMLRIEPYRPSQATSAIDKSTETVPASPRSNPELEELKDALQIARDSIVNLQERLKVKEDNIASCRKLLAEVRGDLTAAAERHVQEMKALQETIYQQQQAYARYRLNLKAKMVKVQR